MKKRERQYRQPGARGFSAAVPPGRRAVTITEILVVLFILVIATTASISIWFNHHRDTQVGGEARKIARLMATARSYAVADNTHYQVTFWPEGMAFWIDEINAGGAVVRPKVTTPERMAEQVEIDQILGGALTFSGACVSLRFYPDGTSVDATIYIVEKTADHADDSQFYTVKLYAPTAQAAVFENQKL